MGFPQDYDWVRDRGLFQKVSRGEMLEAIANARNLTNENILDEKIADEVVSATAGHTPGAEMGYAGTTGNISTTAVFATVASLNLPITVTGEGRAVDIDLFIPRLYHSVADSEIYGIIASQIVGSGNTVYEQIIGHSSPHTDRSNPFHISRRKVLVDGTDYTFGFYVCSVSQAGTIFAGAAGGLQRMEAKVTSR